MELNFEVPIFGCLIQGIWFLKFSNFSLFLKVFFFCQKDYIYYFFYHFFFGWRFVSLFFETYQ